MRGTKPILRAIEGGLSDMPPAPAWMHPLAKAEWNRVVPGLIERGVLAESDLGTLESYCVAVGQIRQCEAVLQSEEMFVQSERSAPRPHPAFRVMHTAQTLARQLAAELGLTPASRNKPVKVEGDKADEGGWGDDLLA